MLIGDRQAQKVFWVFPSVYVCLDTAQRRIGEREE
jgi:hypothetical protein